MPDALRAALERCYEDNPGAAAPESSRRCRWCREPPSAGHAPECPCAALALALSQRDALAAYVRAERRSLTMHGAVRLGPKGARPALQRRRDDAVRALEAAAAELRALGIDGLVRPDPDGP